MLNRAPARPENSKFYAWSIAVTVNSLSWSCIRDGILLGGQYNAVQTYVFPALTDSASTL